MNTSPPGPVRRAERPHGDQRAHSVLQLQRSAGNAAVTTALSVQRKEYKSIAGEIKGPLSKDKEGVSTFNLSDGWPRLPD